MEASIKMNGWRAFRSGFTRSVRYPPVILSAYLSNLLTAVLLIIMPAVSLIGPAHRTAIQDAANGIDMWLIQEILGSASTYSLLQGAPSGPPPCLQQGFLLGSLTLMAIPLAAWLLASFLRGGILLTYVEAPQLFSWRRFWWGCWHWFGAFLLINLILAGVTLILGLVLLTGTLLAVTAGVWTSWLIVPLIVVIVAPWLAILDYTHLFAVSGQTRNVFKAFGKAFILIFRRPLDLLGLYGLSLLLLVFVHIIFRTGLSNIPPTWWPLAFVATQAFILTRLWARLVRWAGAAVLIENT